MFEFVRNSEQVDELQDSLRVSGPASYALELDMNEHGDHESQVGQINAEIAVDNPILAIAAIGTEFALDEAGVVADYVGDGFAFGYKLLTYEAEVRESPLPILQPDTLYDFNIFGAVRGNDHTSYYEERYAYLNTHNPNYLHGLEAIIADEEDLSLEEADSFLLGGIMAHDLLLSQKRSDSVEATLTEAVPQERPLTRLEAKRLKANRLVVDRLERYELAGRLIALYTENLN